MIVVDFESAEVEVNICREPYTWEEIADSIRRMNEAMPNPFSMEWINEHI